MRGSQGTHGPCAKYYLEPLPLHHSFSQQQLTMTELQQSSLSPTNSSLTHSYLPSLKQLATERGENAAPLLQCNCCRGTVKFMSVGGAVT
jgi:hypothetical protein